MTPDTEDQSGWLDELADSIITMIGNPDYHQQGSIEIIKTMISQHEARVVRAKLQQLSDMAKEHYDYLLPRSAILDILAELSAAPQDTQPCKKHGKYTCSACPPEGDSDSLGETAQPEEIIWWPYEGKYDKIWYDIKLKHGIIIYHCWPNANTFHTDNGVIYEGSDVTHVAISKEQS